MMTTKECIVYKDNELLYEHLKSELRSIKNKAWACLTKCAASIMKTSGWRIKNSREKTEEDIMQDAIVKLMVNINEGKYEKIEKRKFPFCAVLKNTFVKLCIDVYRKDKKRFTQVELEEADKFRAYLPDYLEIIIQQEELEMIERKKDALLTEQQRKAYDLMVIKGFTRKEVAEQMGIGEAVVSNYVSKARKILEGLQ